MKMLYEVNVTRTSTATLTIRVEADDRESARGMALELAGEQDFAGCVVDYDFDANDTVEVKDENAPDCADETAPEGNDTDDETTGDHPDLLQKSADGVPPHVVNIQYAQRKAHDCALCPAVMPDDINQAIDLGWIPSYWDGEVSCDGPVCPDCLEKYLTLDHESGELVFKELIGEYVSVWEGGDEYRSACTVNIRTRTVEIEQTYDAGEEDGMLMREYVVLDAKEYKAANADTRDEYTAKEQSQMFFWK